MSLFICKICNKEFETKQALGGHKSAAHKDTSRYSVKRKLSVKKDTNVYICRYCGDEKTGKNSHINHERCCSLNPNRSIIYLQNKTGKNQFIKAKELNLPKPNVSKETRKKLKEKAIGRSHTEETKQKLSEIALKNGLGGVRQSKRINYKGKVLGSSYEYELAEDLDKNGIRWDTCKRFIYIDPFGKKRTYTPDLYLIDFDVYLDPKNDFLIENVNPRLGFSDLEKIEIVETQHNIKILVLNKDQLKWNEIKKLL